MRLGSEAGYTLVEMMLAGVMGLIVLGAAAMLLTASVSSQPRVSDRAGEIQRARTAMETISRELRQGSHVFAGSSTSLSLITYVDKASCGGAQAAAAIQCRVDYSCASGTCTRTERQPNGSGNAEGVQVVSGLSNPIVFTYSPSAVAPTYVGVTLTFPASGSEDAITLRDGVTLRNPAAPSS